MQAVPWKATRSSCQVAKLKHAACVCIWYMHVKPCDFRDGNVNCILLSRQEDTLRTLYKDATKVSDTYLGIMCQARGL